MAESNDTKGQSPALAQEAVAEPENAVTESHTTANGEAQEGEEELDQGAETIFSLTVNLPHKPHKMQLMVSSQEQVHDVRQSVIELPDTFQYSCFHLEHNGERINDFIQLSDVKDLVPESELKLVEDPYTEKEARIHVIRVRELIGAAGDRTDTLQGILSGLSLYDSVTESEAPASEEAAAAKTDGAAHPLADYDFQAAGTLSTLLPPTQESHPKTIKMVGLSPWNPPPYHLRQKGHLLYLQATTLEGEQYQITSHVSGFYVNKSTNARFDPTPRTAPKAHAAHSLLALISDLSPSFEPAFEKLQEYNNQKEPLTNFQITNSTPASPWIVPSESSPLTTHQSDLTRSQESYLISGIENTETLRDWNEEFQSTRELPKETAQDRVFRERLTSKLFADYNDAAARGAVLVARGEVAPLNPTESRDAQIFVYNNVFFSFGADGVGTFASEGGDEAARVATGKDVMGVRMVNQLDIDGLFTPGTVVIDYLGKRLVGQSIVPGIFKQRDPGENQIDYGAVDGKEVIAADEKFVPVFEKLSKALKVKKHAVWDKAGKRHELEGSVETKGLLGTDGRKYVLDLYRVTPLDIEWMEENGTAISSPEQNDGAGEATYPHRMTAAKAEEDATKAVTEGEADAESTEKAAKPADSEKDRIDITDFAFSLNPDVFSGQEPQTEEEIAEWAKDEEEVRSAGKFLRDTVLPELVRDLKEGDVGFPMDGESLSRLLHKRGINIRYLGVLAGQAEGRRLEALKILSIQEMISRSFKHIAGNYLRYLPIPFTSACIAHLLNCLLGTEFNESPVAQIDASLKALYADTDLSFKDVTPESLRKEIEAQTLKRYKFTLEENWFAAIKPVQMLREVSLKMGFQLVSKDYFFTKEAAANAKPAKVADAPKENTNGATATTSSKKKKKTRSDSPSGPKAVPAGPPMTFSADDVLNVVPIIKEASPKSALAEEALEAGRISILQGQKKLGQELLLESLSLHEQIYGIMHPEVARVYNTLSMLYYQLDEKDAAVELARKAVIVSERTLGVDSAETLLSYLNLGLFSHANGETKLALTYIKHALQLWKIIYGQNHPDSITTTNNAAVMLQHLKLYHESRLWFEASLDICESVFGKQSINAGTLLFQLAQALALDQDSKASVNRMRESYNIFLTELGAEDKNTKEAESWLEQLTQNATAEASSGRDPRNAMGMDSRSIDELLKFIEGKEQKKPSSKKRPGQSNPKRRGGASKA
ncbi:hypothetical protein VF21_10261 [Pseudogymnoascus sp. 05NY08]|nr:hypothetical protein VF21_10261 [Pseudogymnoascus sp. 05NY08]